MYAPATDIRGHDWVYGNAIELKDSLLFMHGHARIGGALPGARQKSRA